MDTEREFTAIVEEHRDRIYRLCRCYVRDADERDDVFQDVLLNIWRSLRDFEGRASLATWVYRITVNTCLGFVRREKRRREMLGDGALLAEERQRAEEQHRATETAQEGSDDTDADVELLYACIDRLPLVDRSVISLYLEDASPSDMADVLGISEGNLRVKLHRIRKKLKTMIEETCHDA